MLLFVLLWRKYQGFSRRLLVGSDQTAAEAAILEWTKTSCPEQYTTELSSCMVRCTPASLLWLSGQPKEWSGCVHPGKNLRRVWAFGHPAGSKLLARCAHLHKHMAYSPQDHVWTGPNGPSDCSHGYSSQIRSSSTLRPTRFSVNKLSEVTAPILSALIPKSLYAKNLADYRT